MTCVCVVVVFFPFCPQLLLLPSIPFPLLCYIPASMAEGCAPGAGPWAIAVRRRRGEAQSVGSVGRERTGSPAAGVSLLKTCRVDVPYCVHYYYLRHHRRVALCKLLFDGCLWKGNNFTRGLRRRQLLQPSACRRKEKLSVIKKRREEKRTTDEELVRGSDPVTKNNTRRKWIE